MKQKARYLLTCIRKNILAQGISCPSCGQSHSSVVSRKFFVTALRRCKECRLLFRTPTTSQEENRSFYQEEYSQGFTTNFPSDELLAKYLEDGFEDSEKDYSTYIDVVCAAGGMSEGRLFDFGCSWGYGSWQFMQQGFDVEAFEISRPRASFAREKLGVKIHSSLADISGSFDVFFSSHVLEHIPSVRESIDFGMTILRKGGLFVAFVPNGSIGFFNKNSEAWNRFWGLVHPCLIDDDYLKTTFSGKHFLISSEPYSIQEIKSWSIDKTDREAVLQADGCELLILARK